MGNPVSLSTTQKVDIIASVLPAGAAFPGPTTYTIDNASLGSLVPLPPESVTFVAATVGTGTITGTSGTLTDTVVVTVTAPVATSLVLTPGTPVNQ